MSKTRSANLPSAASSYASGATDIGVSVNDASASCNGTTRNSYDQYGNLATITDPESNELSSPRTTPWATSHQEPIPEITSRK